MGEQEGKRAWWDKPLVTAIIGGVLTPIILSLLSYNFEWVKGGGLVAALGGLTKASLENPDIRDKLKGDKGDQGPPGNAGPPGQDGDPGLKSVRVVWAFISYDTSPPSVLRQSSPKWLANVVPIGTGIVTLNFVQDFFSQSPVCVPVGDPAGTIGYNNGVDATAEQVTIELRGLKPPNPAVQRSFGILCAGQHGQH